MRFAGKVALITGGGAGIGLASAQRLVREGARVVLWDISAQALAAAAADLGEQALCQRVDVTDEAQVDQAMAAAVAQMGRLDIVVNSAGIVGPTQPFWENEPAAWRKVLDLNLTGVFLVSRAAVPHLTRAGGGRIVNLASIAGKEGNRNQAAYSASKAGVIGLTKSLAREFAPQHIRVNAIAPGPVATAMVSLEHMSAEWVQKELAIPQHRLGAPEEIAATALFLASDLSRFYCGQVLGPNGGSVMT